MQTTDQQDKRTSQKVDQKQDQIMVEQASDKSAKDPFLAVETLHMHEHSNTCIALGNHFDMKDRVTGQYVAVKLPTENTVVITSFLLDPLTPEEAAKRFKVATPALRAKPPAKRQSSADKTQQAPPIDHLQTPETWVATLFE